MLIHATCNLKLQVADTALATVNMFGIVLLKPSVIYYCFSRPGMSSLSSDVLGVALPPDVPCQIRTYHEELI